MITNLIFGVIPFLFSFYTKIGTLPNDSLSLFDWGGDFQLQLDTIIKLNLQDVRPEIVSPYLETVDYRFLEEEYLFLIFSETGYDRSYYIRKYSNTDSWLKIAETDDIDEVELYVGIYENKVYVFKYKNGEKKPEITISDDGGVSFTMIDELEIKSYDMSGNEFDYAENNLFVYKNNDNSYTAYTMEDIRGKRVFLLNRNQIFWTKDFNIYRSGTPVSVRSEFDLQENNIYVANKELHLQSDKMYNNAVLKLFNLQGQEIYSLEIDVMRGSNIIDLRRVSYKGYLKILIYDKNSNIIANSEMLTVGR